MWPIAFAVILCLGAVEIYGDTYTTCENNVMTISCPAGSVIQVSSANYGRTDGVTCIAGEETHILSTSCSAANSLSIVTNLCQNQASCTVQANNGVFTDPCLNTYKYLTVQATCFNPCDSSPCANGGTCTSTGTAYSCSCAAGWSGTNCQTNPCLSSPCLNGGTCTSTGTAYTCSCTTEWSGTNCQTNPCTSSPCANGGTCTSTGTAYSCTCASPFSGTNCQTGTSTACESNALTISCPAGAIQVSSANYGRTDAVTCIAGEETHIKSTTCSASNSLSVVSSKCQNQASCTVQASNSVFTDPCDDTYKYLTVQWTCA